MMSHLERANAQSVRVLSDRIIRRSTSSCQEEEEDDLHKQEDPPLPRRNHSSTRISRISLFTVIPLLLAHCIYPIGCDGISVGSSSSSASSSLSSPSRRELCSSCRGDNSTCRVVSGIFTRPQLNVGYNLVANIPRGACNINITEIRRSPNHLALRRKDTSFIFNGDWRLSWSGEYEGVGTTFHYTRQDLKTLESIHGLGPISEPVDLMVLYQQPNPGIKYEYLFPFTESSHNNNILPESSNSNRNGHHHRQPAAATLRPASYVNLPAAANNNGISSQQHHLLPPQQHQPASPPAFPGNHPYNSISSFPLKPVGPSGHPAGGPGAILYPGEYNKYPQPPPQVVQPVPVQATSQHHHLHNHHGRRRNNHEGHPRTPGSSSSKQSVGVPPPTGDKKFYWKITGYSNCTEPCGGGMQRSVIRCVRGQTGNPVSDRRCSAEEKPPGQMIRCNLKPCPAEWVIGDWSSCSTDCGDGLKTRSIHCQQRISPTLTMRVAEGACLQQKPETQTACTLRPCNHWQTTEWSQCSARCGNGVRKRTIICVGSAGVRLTPENCPEEDKPAELTACNMGPCEGVSWFISEWSPHCSQQCGGGLQTRHVVCSGLNLNQRKKTYSPGYHNLSDFSWQHGRKSASSELETNLIEDDDNFRADHDHNEVYSTGRDGDDQEFFCDESKKPPEQRECFSDRSCGEPVWFAGDWSDCSVSCGNGIRTRQVICVLFTRGKFKVASDSLCQNELKPEEKEPCERNQCPPRWFTTDWNECSALCGGGLQKRSVSCRASNWTLSSSLCSDKDRPLERRSCNEQKCTLEPASGASGGSQSDSSGMVKDKPVFPQSGGVVTSIVRESPSGGTVLDNESPLRYHYHHTSTNNNSSQQGTRFSPVAPTLQSHSPSGGQENEMREEAEDAECTDQYRNCALVVQARLCRYKYYRSVCCNSCLDAIS